MISKGKPSRQDIQCRFCQSKCEVYLSFENIRGNPMGMGFCQKHYDELKKITGDEKLW